MKDYIIYWRGTESEFSKFDDAVAWAKDCTREEEKFDTALIINRKYVDNVKMYTLRWIIFDMFELVRVQI